MSGIAPRHCSKRRYPGLREVPNARVAELAEAIAEEMNLKPAEIENVRVGALLHDIGKVEISTRLIQKASALTVEECSEMSAHTVQGPS